MASLSSKFTARLRFAAQCLALVGVGIYSAWPAVLCYAQTGKKPNMGTLQANKMPTTGAAKPVYRVILRIARPVWNAQTQLLSAPPRALTGNLFRFANPDSDAQFLQQLREANPNFVFEGVRNKRTFTLPADKELEVPSSLTSQKLWLGVFIQNKNLLVDHIVSRDSQPLNNGKIQAGNTANSANKELPVQYKVNMTEAQFQQVRRASRIMLSYRIYQSYPDAQGLKEFMRSDLMQFMQPGETACLGTALAVLDVPIDPKPKQPGEPNPTKPVLMPTDLVFATIVPQGK